MMTKQIQDYTIYMSKVLGRGTYGSVYEGKRDRTGEKVAVKILCKANSKYEYMKAALGNEINIHKMLFSQNIVRLQDVMESNKNYYIIQQLCDGDLSAIIRPGQKMSAQDAVNFLQQICNGFLVLVREGIIHRDLKPANIMRKGGILKIGDFGFAKHIQHMKMLTTAVGTPLYMSPEILEGKEYTSKCDVWALGFIFYELLHGKTPWTAGSELQLLKNIKRIPLRIPRDDLSDEIKDFLVRVLQIDDKLRSSWDEIFRHPIFKGYFTSKNESYVLFENKLKMIMNKMRFFITTHNLDLNKVLQAMGYASPHSQIGFEKFEEFLHRVYEDINHQEAKYIFVNTDIDRNGAISVIQVQQLMARHGISFQSQYSILPHFDPSNEETFVKLLPQTSRKISECLKKLYKIIKKQKITLQSIFSKFDHNKNNPNEPHCLTLKQFSKLIRKLSIRVDEGMIITDEELQAAFNFIDEDHSSTIEYAQLNGYYCKINGIRDQTANRSPLQPSREKDFEQGNKNLKLKCERKETNQNVVKNQKNSPNPHKPSKDRNVDTPSKIQKSQPESHEKKSHPQQEKKKDKKEGLERKRSEDDKNKKIIHVHRSPGNKKAPTSPRTSNEENPRMFAQQSSIREEPSQIRMPQKYAPNVFRGQNEMQVNEYYHAQLKIEIQNGQKQKQSTVIHPSVQNSQSLKNINDPPQTFNILKLLRERLLDGKSI